MVDSLRSTFADRGLGWASLLFLLVGRIYLGSGARVGAG